MRAVSPIPPAYRLQFRAGARHSSCGDRRNSGSARSLIPLSWALLALTAAGWSAGRPAPAVRLADLRGVRRTVPDSGSKATVLLFLTPDCPIANAYMPEINRIVAAYSRRGIAFLVVYGDASIAIPAALRHVKEYGIRCPAVLDSRRALVKLAGATVTPEAAVFDRRGNLAYRGRIDDLFVDYGKRRERPTRRDLRAALEAVLAGRPAPVPRTKAIGCFLPEG